MDTLLRTLVDLRDRQIQKSRIAFSNRIGALEREADSDPDGEQTAILTRYRDTFTAIEDQLNNDIKDLCSGVPIIEAMIAVKGISYGLAAKVACMIDIERASTISALWRYAGYGVTDGKREKGVRGERRHYNGRLKSACYLIATSFLKSGSPYRAEYDKAKENYQQAHPDWTKLHIHNAALGNMIKLYLAHLWLFWREMEGLPTRVPYVQEYMEHTTISAPTDYGWPAA